MGGEAAYRRFVPRKGINLKDSAVSAASREGVGQAGVKSLRRNGSSFSRSSAEDTGRGSRPSIGRLRPPPVMSQPTNGRSARCCPTSTSGGSLRSSAIGQCCVVARHVTDLLPAQSMNEHLHEVHVRRAASALL